MKVLIIAPHPDDEIIGVGGTIAKRVKDGHEVYVCVVTKGTEPLFDEKFIEQGRKENNFFGFSCSNVRISSEIRIK